MKKLSIWEVFLFILSIYVVAELYLSSIITYSERTKSGLLVIDTIICGFFLADFFYRFYMAKNKMKYLKSNWIDFISSIPMVGFLRIGRLVKIIRVLRVVRSGKFFFSIFNRNDSLKSLRNLGIIIFFLIILFSISIHQLEKEVNPSFDTLAESFWWTINSTITFGFFQDISPISVEGRAISIVLILMGMVLFGTFIGFVSDYFITEEDIHEDVKSLHLKIDGLNKKLDELIYYKERKDLDKVEKDNKEK
jgi:voltage-gated potassium channel